MDETVQRQARLYHGCLYMSQDGVDTANIVDRLLGRRAQRGWSLWRSGPGRRVPCLRQLASEWATPCGRDGCLTQGFVRVASAPNYSR